MKNKICIIQSVYNFDITNKMLRNAIKELKKNGIKNIKVIKVPGSFEIPQVVSKFIKNRPNSLKKQKHSRKNISK